MRVNRRPMVVLSTLLTLTVPVVAALVLTGSAGPTQAATAQLSAPQAARVAEVLRPVLSAAAPAVPATQPVKAVKAVKAATSRAVAGRTRAVPTRAVPTRAVPTRAVPRTAVTRAAAPAPAPKPAATTAPRPATSDDYPWRSATTNDPDTWGFTKRQCVSFAAFRLAQHGKALDNASQHWDSALSWDETAARRGVAVSTTPRVGAIAHWNAGESSSVSGGRFTAGGYGHVGYVAAVYGDGTALIEQYNLGGDRSYSVMRMTAPRYLVF